VPFQGVVASLERCALLPFQGVFEYPPGGVERSVPDWSPRVLQ